MHENWEEINGYPEYMVSDQGSVHNIKLGRPLKPRSNGLGYQQVVLYKNGRGREWYVHHLVAQAFMEEYSPGLQIRWWDRDRSNNALTNLYMQNGALFKQHIVSQANGRARRVVIVETQEVFLSVRDCAEYIGGDYSNIYKCIREPHRTHRGLHFAYFEEE